MSDPDDPISFFERPKRQTQASHQAGYPKIASKVLKCLIVSQIEGTKIKKRLGIWHKAKRYFWVAVGAQKKK